MIELLASSVRLSTPLVFAAMGGLLAERAGIATICIEGVMLTSAFTAATVDYYCHSAWISLLAAMGVGIGTLGLHAFLRLYGKADAIVSGVAVNLLASGVTPFFTKIFFGSSTNTGGIPMEDRFHSLPLPFLHKIPIVGVLFDQMPLVYAAFVMPFFVQFLLYRTRFGLRILASGDDPKTLQTAGVSPVRVRYWTLLLGGAIISLGGTYLSIAHASQFTRDMTAGRGFIALAAVIFGKWQPWPAFFACLFFGFADALQIQLQSASFFSGVFPVQLIQAFPYLITLGILVAFAGRARPPRSIGEGV